MCCVAALQESEAVELASKLEDKAWALEKLLGPTLQPEGSTNRLKSEEAKALTEHLYTPDRWDYELLQVTLCCWVAEQGQGEAGVGVSGGNLDKAGWPGAVVYHLQPWICLQLHVLCC